MIKNILANGCSFTQDQDYYKCWPKVIAEKFDIRNFTNLARGGAGNRYIATSTIEWLESHDLIPAETLVLVMWSGISRKDVVISPSWAHYFRHTYDGVHESWYPVAQEKHDTVFYLSSGGIVGDWLDDNTASKYFHPLYRAADSASLCKESLHDFVYLQNYLKGRGYQFALTCFMNLWNPSAVDQGEMDYRIGLHDFSLTKRFDFSNWIFVNDQKDGFAEFALRFDDSSINDHPGGAAHTAFANDILIPALKGILS